MTKREFSRQLKDYPVALTVAEVAEILRVSTKTVYKMIKTEKLFAVRVGREHRIAKSNLIDYLRAADKQSSHPKVVGCDKNSDCVWTCGKTCSIVRVDQIQDKKRSDAS